MLKIYHNARCGKSRCALQALESRQQPFEIVEYLKTPPTAAELAHILQRMVKKPLDIVRKKEPLFVEKFAHQTLSDTAWLQILVENPTLIERPIVVTENKAWIARDEEGLAQIACI